MEDARAADNCAVLTVVGLLVVGNSNLLEAQAHSQEGSGGSGAGFHPDMFPGGGIPPGNGKFPPEIFSDD